MYKRQVLVLLLALCLRTLQTGLRCPDALGCNICVGIFAALFLQCVINLGMNLQEMCIRDSFEGVIL